MKFKSNVTKGLLSSLKSFIPWPGEANQTKKEMPGKGEGLAKLHEYQHQVIIGLFKITIAGLIAFWLIVFSFTLFTIFDPYAPTWVGIMMISVGMMILIGCYRTIREFRAYRKNYTQLMGQLQAKLRQYLGRSQPGEKKGKVRKQTESKVLSVLKPQEYKGWDAKPCTKCHKSIELMASVCQHCGQDQQEMLHN